MKPNLATRLLRMYFWDIYVLWRKTHTKYDGKEQFLVVVREDKFGIMLESNAKGQYTEVSSKMFPLNDESICIFFIEGDLIYPYILKLAPLQTVLQEVNETLDIFKGPKIIGFGDSIITNPKGAEDFYIFKLNSQYANYLLLHWADICQIPFRDTPSQFIIYQIPSSNEEFDNIIKMAKEQNFYPKKVANQVSCLMKSYLNVNLCSKTNPTYASQCICLTEEHTKTIRAFCLFSMTHEIPPPKKKFFSYRSIPVDTSFACISFILVKESNLGLGSALLDAIIATLQSRRNGILIECQVKKEDHSAISFWRHIGFNLENDPDSRDLFSAWRYYQDIAVLLNTLNAGGGKSMAV